MRNLFVSLFIAVFAFGLMITDAQAKRFGGGKSFGYNRSMSNSGSASNASRVQPAAKPAAAAAGNRWLGPLAGLAVGGLLASLFMGHGLGSGILSWLMVAGVIFVVWRLISRFKQGNRPAQQTAAYQVESGRTFTNTPYTSTIQDSATSATPEDSEIANFDETSFLRRAKTVFIRLQAAYDSKDLADIREFTTPEIFAEIQLQIHERGNEINQTEVVTIDAKLLDLTHESHGLTASVLFSGLVRERQDANPESINEIWHLNKEGENWVIAGIQQQSS